MAQARQDPERSAAVRRLAGVTSQMTTAAVGAMDERLPWFTDLDAEERSWITLVARSGIDGFVSWFAAEHPDEFSPAAVFDAAPRALTRRISLHQTVELVRTTIAVVEEQIQVLLPENDRALMSTAIVHYSREVAFGAAEVYARAAEMRGSWDARIEALVVDAVVRSETDETVVSRASTLGWVTGTKVAVAVGPAPEQATAALDDVRRTAERQRLGLLAALQGDRLVLIVSGPDLVDTAAAVRATAALEQHFGDGPIVVGPLVDDLVDASVSARAAIAGARAAVAWPEGPRTLSALDVLPERALAGDGHARRTLAQDVYGPLEQAGGDLLSTCVGFLDHGCSVEGTARALFVHANTVRYRLKRIQEVTGYSPMDPREAYVLRLAITLGRLAQRR
ncbi:PucR family transcriptional regulator [Aestuariimicrobium ganziense]|uniref:PucR family transcriptional regulator n=1 Tax=Aestuariimicrobium ganziense TaxID=2773677 RepID=UPI001940C9F9|nr:helix-turn-helix domain-containing protein [Aestuariimicrobium ganziense]